MYARELTRKELMEGGITEITPDGKVFKNGTEIKLSVNKQGYYIFSIYERNADGSKVKVPMKHARNKGYYVFRQRWIGLHRAVWAWYNEIVPTGYVVDHINNKHESIEDYNLSNLQLLTPKENVTKERKDIKPMYMSCLLNHDRKFYEDKLNYYLSLYETAKLNKDSNATHKLRSYISQYRAKLRFYDDNYDSSILTVEQVAIIRILANYYKDIDKKSWHEVVSYINGKEHDAMTTQRFIDLTYEYGLIEE